MARRDLSHDFFEELRAIRPIARRIGADQVLPIRAALVPRPHNLKVSNLVRCSSEGREGPQEAHFLTRSPDSSPVYMTEDTTLSFERWQLWHARSPTLAAKSPRGCELERIAGSLNTEDLS